MDENNKTSTITKENELLKKQLEEQKNSYKKLSTELGQSVFENEDLKYENKKLKQKIEELEEEIKELKEFKEEVESSKMWKVKSIIK